MPTNRTPAQWAHFCAEKVMGWKPILGQSGYFYAPDTRLICTNAFDGDERWSPWENLADAREVLERLMTIRGASQYHIGRWPDAFEVTIGEDTYDSGSISDSSPGRHEGPATCWLAESVLGER